MKILYWNVERFPNGLEGFYAIINSYNPDVICLQNVHNDEKETPLGKLKFESMAYAKIVKQLQPHANYFCDISAGMSITSKFSTSVHKGNAIFLKNDSLYKIVSYYEEFKHLNNTEKILGDCDSRVPISLQELVLENTVTKKQITILNTLGFEGTIPEGKHGDQRATLQREFWQDRLKNIETIDWVFGGSLNQPISSHTLGNLTNNKQRTLLNHLFEKHIKERIGLENMQYNYVLTNKSLQIVSFDCYTSEESHIIQPAIYLGIVF